MVFLLGFFGGGGCGALGLVFGLFFFWGVVFFCLFVFCFYVTVWMEYYFHKRGCIFIESQNRIGGRRPLISSSLTFTPGLHGSFLQRFIRSWYKSKEITEDVALIKFCNAIC